MEYGKKVMRMSELEEMGFPKEYLKNAYANPKQDFAWKISPTKRNSPIVFDVEKFEKYRQETMKAERNARKVYSVIA